MEAPPFLMRLRYSDSIPKLLLPIVRERVEAIMAFVPDWVDLLTIEYDINEDDLAACEADTEYRMVTITVYPRFFDESDWKHTLVHEVGHALLDAYTALVHQIVTTFIPDETVRAFVLKQLEVAEETVVEDLAILLRKFEG